MSDSDTSSAHVILTRRPRTPTQDALRALFRTKSAILGMVILFTLVLVAIFAPVIAPYDPNKVLIGIEKIKMRSGPCIHLLGCPQDQPQHILGVDGNVRDFFSRVVYGSRISLIVGITTVGFAIVVGTILGAVAGFAGGTGDNVIMRLMDVLLAFPALLLAIAIVTVLGEGLVNALLAIAIVSIPTYARVARASVLSVKEWDFVLADRAIGVPSTRILTRSILPHTLTPLIVAGHAGHRHGDPGCGGALIPGPGRPAAHGRVGLDAGPGAQPGLHCAAPGLFPGLDDHADGAGVQLAR